MRHRYFCLVIALLAIPIGFATARASGAEVRVAAEKPWSVEAKLKYYFRSHTSYEFGNPFPPNQAPLSRLEFPLNSWWAGAEVRRSFPRFSVGIEALRNITRETEGTFKDSDWEDDDHPTALSIYSESNCRLEPSYMVRGDVDLKIADWVGLPARFDLRPVAGFRWQRFTLVSHDGSQTSPLSGGTVPDIDLTGDGIRFEQTYRHYFLGIRSSYNLDGLLPVPRVKLLMQLDWAYVEGDNEDRHLLRPGNRLTFERTSGDAWHASLGLKCGLTENLSAGLEADYLRIRTTGTHRLSDDVANIDFTFAYGVKVWSDQISLLLSLEYLF